MHGRIKNFEGVYTLHTAHHRAYPRSSFTSPTSGSLMYKGLVLCLEHVIVFMLPAALVISLFNVEMAIVFAAFGVIHFAVYNRLHPSMHLKHDLKFLPRWYRDAVLWNHLLHHNHPTQNFCVSLVGADILLGTCARPTFRDKKDWYNLTVKSKQATEGAQELDALFISYEDNCLFSSKTSRYMENGYAGPAPGPEMDAIGRAVLKLIGFLFIGDIEITGSAQGWIEAQNKGRLIVTNHPSWKEVFVIRSVFPIARTMAAQGVMKFLGLGYLLGPFLGCWGAAPGRGVAVNTGVELIKQGETVAVCAEGWAYHDQVQRPFKEGAAKIAIASGATIIPVNFKYNANPEPQWFCNLWFPLQVVLNALDPRQRAGLKVIIGEPISPKHLDKERLTALLEYGVKKLGCI